ncbi:MAG TPA: hypothetical protein VFK32_02310 [Tepidiformaceae bacterium]|nr:hypothetical protein [Tepidiformaceae bacterium]
MPRSRLLAIPLAAVLLLTAACSGESEEPAPLPRATEAEAERVVVDGVAYPQSIVRVRFDRAVRQAGGPIPFTSNFEFTVPTYDLATGELSDERVLVQEAEITSGNRVLELSVDTIVPDGATLTITNRAFDRDDETTSTIDVTSNVTSEHVLFATSVFQTLDPTLFESGERTVTPADRDPALVRQSLAAHLEARGASAEVTAAALQTYDTMPAGIVAAPKLRAALAALTGTFGQAAIDSVLTAENCTGQPAARLAFETPPDFPDLLARVTYTTDGRRVFSFSPSLEAERIEHLMPLLLHEPIHCDQEDGTIEEVVATAFDTFLYIHLLASDPELAIGGSVLTRDLAIDAIAFINSGRLLPESAGILPTEGVVTVLPGTSADYPSFADFIAAAYSGTGSLDSPVEPVAQSYADSLALGSGLPQGTAFDLQYLDALLSAALDPTIFTAAIVALDLAPAN